MNFYDRSPDDVKVVQISGDPKKLRAARMSEKLLGMLYFQWLGG